MLLVGDIVGRSVVIGVRVPRELKEELDRLGIDYSKEIRGYLRRLVRIRRAEELIRRAEEIQRRSRKVEGNLSAEVIREDRESR